MDLFELTAILTLDKSKYDNGIEDAKKDSKTLGEKISGGLKSAAKAGALAVGGVTAAGVSIVSFAKDSAATADKIDKMSQKIGISRKAYQELDFVCSQSGMSVDSLQAGMKTLTNAMDGASKGTKTNVEAFEALGVSVTNTDGSLREQEDVLFDTLSALQNVSNQTEKARLATNLFGRSGTELMPLLNGASGSIDEMRQTAEELGLVLSDDVIDSGVEMTDSLDQMERAFGSVKTEVGAALMPVVTEGADWVIEHMPQIKEVVSDVFEKMESVVNIAVDAINLAIDAFQFLGEHIDVVAPIVVGLTAAIIAFKIAMAISALIEGVSMAITAYKAANEGATIAQWLLNAAMNANPFVLIVALIIGLVSAIIYLWNTNEGFRNAVITAWETIKKGISTAIETVKTTVETVWNAITTAVSTAVTTVQTAVETAFNAVSTAVTTVLTTVQTFVSTAWNSVSTKVSTTVGKMRTAVTTGFNAIKSAVTTPLTAVQTKISSVWNGAVTLVTGAIGKIKGALNFRWKLPDLKLPHISVSGGTPPFGIAGKGSLPKFHVEWYAKAMNGGMILDRPTIFGMDADGNWLGGGETGSEVVVGTNSLMGMIQKAVSSSINGVIGGYNQTINVYSPKPLSASEVARQTKNNTRLMLATLRR